MTAHTLWLAWDLAEGEVESLRREFPDVKMHAGPELGSSRQKEVSVLIVNGPITDDFARSMPKLRWVHTLNGGAGRVLVPTVLDGPVDVTTTTGIHGVPFAEFGIACLYALAKGLPAVLDAQRASRWDRDVFAVDRVAGKTAGIVGLGTVGSELAKRLDALGLRVVATKRTVGESKPPYVDELGGPEWLPDLLGQSDVVFLCLSTGPDTEGMIGEDELGAMPSGAYFVSLTAVRTTIDEAALARALRDGRLAGAALNMLANSPLEPESELWGLPNCIISPGLGGDDPYKWQSQRPVLVDYLRGFLSGKGLPHAIDKQRGY